MSEPEKVYSSSKPDEAGVKSQLYKSLLNQQAQKLWKQLPLYQTVNEGFEHLPKFRTTIWVNGVSYTSPNTFQQRKMAETDASKIAYSAIMHKLRIEASQLVHENKHFCKSILVDYAARMKIQQPTYHTIQLDAPVPIFRSSLVFNNESWTGNDSRNKKDAEQSAACDVVLKYLDTPADSEIGNIMSEIIKVKFKYYAEMKNIRSDDNGTNVVVQIGSNNGLTLNKTKGEEVTKIPNMSAPQEPCLVQNATIPVTHQPVDVNQSQIPQVPISAPTPVVPVPNVLTKIPNTSAPQEPCLVQNATIPVTHLPVYVNQAHIPQVPISAPTPVVPVPTALAQTPFTGTNVAPTFSEPSAQTLGHFANIPAAHACTNVVHPGNSEASFVIAAPPPPSSSPAVAQATSASLNSSKKRNRKNKKNAKKKMHIENQSPLPAMALSQVPTFTAQ